MSKYKKVPDGYDRRVKLTPAQKEEVVELWEDGMSIRAIARNFSVSRRLIGFIVHPESYEANKALRISKGGSKQYYDTAKNTKAVKETRHYSKKIRKSLEEAKQ